MRTRGEAIEHLKKRGFDAKEGWGAMADTIWIGSGRRAAPVSNTGETITVYRKTVWIVPHGAAWAVQESFHPWPGEGAEISLAEACARVEQILKTQDD